MSRLDDVRAFYEILAGLAERLGGTRCLADCTGRMAWPARGVYFFFEPGEVRSAPGQSARVVRVGTHALTATSRTTLWNRLSQHRGTITSGAGNHRGSVFRLLVGEALLRRERLDIRSWGVDGSRGAAARKLGLAPDVVRATEKPIEEQVTRVIGLMPFLWVDIGDPPGQASLRGVIERNSIALLSNLVKDAIDPPSPGWLGAHSTRDAVRRSGLWNVNHVAEPYDTAFLRYFEAAALATCRM